MLNIQQHLPRISSRFLVSASLIRGNKQHRHVSLNMQTLNPLVKEVEYAVRGKQNKQC